MLPEVDANAKHVGCGCFPAEYVFDHSWASSCHRTGQSYYPKLQVRRRQRKKLSEPDTLAYPIGVSDAEPH